MPIAEGDVLEIDAAADERRPVLVVSVAPLHAELGLAMVCAIVPRGDRSKRARNDLEVAIPAGLPVTGMILPLQLRTIDSKVRHATRLCTVPRSTVQSVRSRLKALLGLGQ